MICRSSEDLGLMISWTSIRVNCRVGNSRESPLLGPPGQKPETFWMSRRHLDEETMQDFDYVWELKGKGFFTPHHGVTHNQRPGYAETIIRVNSATCYTNDQSSDCL